MSECTLNIVFSVLFFCHCGILLMMIFMNKFTNIVKDDWNLDEIQVDYGNKAWYIVHPNDSIM
jgi:hypothetical protein